MSVSTLEGTTQAYLLNPDGDIAGLLLDGNRQLMMKPPHPAEGLLRIPLGTLVKAEVKAGQKSEQGQQFRFRRWLEDKQALRAAGKIQHWLVNWEGQFRGFIVADGSQVHLPKTLRREFTEQLQLGDRVEVAGQGVKTPYGAVIKAEHMSVVVLETAGAKS